MRHENTQDSHVYEVTVQETAVLLARAVVPVVLFALAMHLGAALGWLPPPRPTLDVDRTVLVVKAEASRAPGDAQVLLLGDSSCLMDVSANDLSDRLKRPVLNLGTLSYVTLAGNARLLQNCAQAKPGQLRAVVLLMHPDTLRLPPAETWQTRSLSAFLSGRDFQPRMGLAAEVGALAGMEIFRGRLLARALPVPLGGAYGSFYGFTDQLEQYLIAHGGSAVDPEKRPFSGTLEYRLATAMEGASAAFSQAVPSGARLCVGITPLPANFARPAYPEIHRKLLHQWAEWLRADVALEKLPAVMDDSLFAQKTHLNAVGQRRYTEILAEALLTVP